MTKERTRISFNATCEECNDYDYWDDEPNWESVQEHANQTRHRVRVGIDFTYLIYADKPVRCPCPNCVEVN